MRPETMRQLDRQLIDACIQQDHRAIPGLLAAGADPNAISGPDSDAESPLTALIYYGVEVDENRNMFVSDEFWKSLELLLESGADINLVVRSSDGCVATALMMAQFTVPEVARFLLEHGADPDIVNEDGETFLDAIEFCLWADYEDTWRDDSDYWVFNSRIRKILLDHGAHRAKTLAKMAELEKQGSVRREIHQACWHLEADRLDALLGENGIGPLDGDIDGLLYEVVERASEFTQKNFVDDPDGYEERLIAVLDVLRKHGSDLNGHGGDALYYAVCNGYVKTARHLLACGADPNRCECGYWRDSRDDLPEHRHYYTFADKVRHWRCRWQKETALAFQAMFP